MKTTSSSIISLAICILALISSCKQEQLPEGVMDTATLTAFLTEAHLIEGYVEATRLENAAQSSLDVNAAYDSLFRKYHITVENYEQSLDYYIVRPQLMQDIYNRVMQRTGAIKEQYPNAVAYRPRIEPPKRTDSIRDSSSDRRSTEPSTSSTAN